MKHLQEDHNNEPATVKDCIKGQYWREVLGIEPAKYADRIRAAIDSGLKVDYTECAAALCKTQTPNEKSQSKYFEDNVKKTVLLNCFFNLTVFLNVYN